MTLLFLQGVSSGRAPGLGWLEIWVFHCIVFLGCQATPAKFQRAQADSGRQWNIPIPCQHNPGAWPDETPCSCDIICLRINHMKRTLLWGRYVLEWVQCLAGNVKRLMANKASDNWLVIITWVRGILHYRDSFGEFTFTSLNLGKLKSWLVIRGRRPTCKIQLTFASMSFFLSRNWFQHRR